ncbi:hypothetical protein B0O99DRAFT_644042 [Bisporella sp. PMI_857]|nr:hypothetical protein B0O99DRAFT_644042 [Bisporella sp. PMI_857]
MFDSHYHEATPLYIQSYADYISFCGFLGLRSSHPDDRSKVACDGFINPASRAHSDSIIIQFQASPLAFIRAITALRKKRQSTTISHISKIIIGGLIIKDQL